MLNPTGWIKLHRNLRNSFSNDIQMNTELWNIYVFLVEQAAWDNFDGLQRGQLRFKASDVKKNIFPNMPIDRVRKLVRILIKKNYIKTSPISNDKKEGSIVEICQYDNFSENCTKIGVPVPALVPTPVPTLVDFCNYSELKTNKYANLAESTSTDTSGVPVPTPVPVFLFIEERNKEIKEEKEEFKEGKISSVDEPPKVSKSLSIIKNDSKKLKRNATLKREEVDYQPVIDAYYEIYRKRYLVKPVINSMTISNAKDLVIRLESTEKAVAIVSFYLTHNNAFYLKNAHAFKFCLNDCEKLHTEYMKKDYIFGKDAKKVEDATANSILLENLLSRNRKERDE
jgi:hypothetical protein